MEVAWGLRRDWGIVGFSPPTIHKNGSLFFLFFSFFHSTSISSLIDLIIIIIRKILGTLALT